MTNEPRTPSDSSKGRRRKEARAEPPPFEPDYDLIAYMEGGQGPGDTGKRSNRVPTRVLRDGLGIAGGAEVPPVEVG